MHSFPLSETLKVNPLKPSDRGVIPESIMIESAEKTNQRHIAANLCLLSCSIFVNKSPFKEILESRGSIIVLKKLVFSS